MLALVVLDVLSRNEFWAAIINVQKNILFAVDNCGSWVRGVIREACFVCVSYGNDRFMVVPFFRARRREKSSKQVIVSPRVNELETMPPENHESKESEYRCQSKSHDCDRPSRTPDNKQRHSTFNHSRLAS